MSDHLPPNWERRLIEVVGGVALQPHDQRVRLLDAWAQAEGGTAAWNPLNTTFALPGSTHYNTVGVRNYKRATEGVCATALTLVNGYYPGILGYLQTGDGPAESCVKQHSREFDTWGTGAAAVLGVLGQ